MEKDKRLSKAFSNYRIWSDGQIIRVPRGQSITKPLSHEDVTVQTRVNGEIREGDFRPPTVRFLNTENHTQIFDEFSLVTSRGSDIRPDWALMNMTMYLYAEMDGFSQGWQQSFLIVNHGDNKFAIRQPIHGTDHHLEFTLVIRTDDLLFDILYFNPNLVLKTAYIEPINVTIDATKEAVNVLY